MNKKKGKGKGGKEVIVAILEAIAVASKLQTMTTESPMVALEVMFYADFEKLKSLIFNCCFRFNTRSFKVVPHVPLAYFLKDLELKQ